MAAEPGTPQATLDLEALDTDTLILDKSFRVVITAMSIHNITTSGREVWIYISPDNTSAAGKRIATYIIAPNDSADLNELLGQALAGDTEKVIAVQKSTGSVLGDMNIKLTYTLYTD